MTLHRFNSVGSSSAPRAKHAPLVALRYEETVQAEPPIPLPQYDSTTRLARSRSARSLATNATTTTTASSGTWSLSTKASSIAASASTPTSPFMTSTPLLSVPSPSLSLPSSSAPSPSLSSFSSSLPSPHSPLLAFPRSPLVILRPPSLVPPPQEQHPALRSRSIRPIAEEGVDGSDDESAEKPKKPAKRDSILASATASTVTLGPGYDSEDGENYFAACLCRSTSTSKSKRSFVPETAEAGKIASPMPVAVPASPPATNARPEKQGPTKASIAQADAAAACPTVPQNGAGVTTTTPITDSNSEKDTSRPSITREKSWRLSTTFGFRSNSFHRKKRSKSTSSTASASSVAATPTSRRNSEADSETTRVNRTAELRISPNDTKSDSSSAISFSSLSGEEAGAVSTAGDGSTAAEPALLPIVTAPPLSSLPKPTDEHASPSKPAKLTKLNPSWPPALASPPASQQNAKSTKPNTTSTTPTNTSRATAKPALPSPSSFASSVSSSSSPSASTASYSSSSSPPCSSSPSLSPSTSSSSSSPSPRRPTHFFLRVLAMSDSRQKKRQSQDGVGGGARDELFAPINTTIPTDSLVEDDFLQSLTFSNRGSVLFGGKRAVSAAAAIAAVGSVAAAAGSPSRASAVDGANAMEKPREKPATASAPAPQLRPLSPAVERESHKVRSLYASDGLGDHGLNWEDGRPSSFVIVSDPIAEEEEDAELAPSRPGSPAAAAQAPNGGGLASPDLDRRRTRDENAASSLSPDMSSLSISGGRLHPDHPAATRTSIISATSAASESTGQAFAETASTEASTSILPSPLPADTTSFQSARSRESMLGSAASFVRRSEYELAGGIENWEDVEAADVDRFGFIHVNRRPHTSASTSGSGLTAAAADRDDGRPDTAGRQRGNSHRRRLRRHSPPGLKTAARSVNTRMSSSTTATAAAAARSSLRSAANRLPHNRDRRWMDEAGDMLTLEPGLVDIAEDEDAERVADALKRKEWERAEKWRRMAKVVRKGVSGEGGAPPAGKGAAAAAGRDGGGMEFEFDLRHPKLVERTWKGIPDRWRAAAWYSFLASSARRRRIRNAAVAASAPADTAPATAAAAADGGETDEQIVAAFHRLQEAGSPDDVQIDLDVPRTVNGHVMFRQRYRGGQRLLFRVLHALSLYFPATGYVQGMASLAATLLCYYDEERCFVMLVRLFHLRGLERLYQPGFAGLMEALGEFERQWLARSNDRIARKLAELGIDAPTYATRWYLTLFNLSVPFPAQLRIWDVFMLLGDGGDSAEKEAGKAPTTKGDKPEASTAAPDKAGGEKEANPTDAAAAAEAFPALTAPKANLDVLHAASLALIDGLHEVLLDADFENAMKAVTSWVPIKDEELLMRVVHAEWKRHEKKKR